MDLFGAGRERPTPRQKQALEALSSALSRGDFEAAHSRVSGVIGGKPTGIDPVRDSVRRPNLNAKQKTDFLLAVVPQAEEVMKATFGRDCFSPSSDVYGRMWGLLDSRGYIRLLLDIANYSSECGEHERAVELSKKVLELNHGDNNGIRGRVPMFLIQCGRPLEALNFCLGWLDHTSPDFDDGICCPKGGYGNLTKYKKEDFSPSSPIKIPIYVYGHVELLYCCALACFHIYGSCELTTSFLRLAHEQNTHIIYILLSHPDKFPQSLNFAPRPKGSEPEANDFVYFSAPIWMPENVRAWLKETAEVVARRKCDVCNKVEPKVADWKKCSGCGTSWYCGVECQTKDWKDKDHKRACKTMRKQQRAMHELGESVLKRPLNT